jgi:hypothetical protein
VVARAIDEFEIAGGGPALGRMDKLAVGAAALRGIGGDFYLFFYQIKRWVWRVGTRELVVKMQ